MATSYEDFLRQLGWVSRYDNENDTTSWFDPNGGRLNDETELRAAYENYNTAQTAQGQPLYGSAGFTPSASSDAQIRAPENMGAGDGMGTVTIGGKTYTRNGNSYEQLLLNYPQEAARSGIKPEYYSYNDQYGLLEEQNAETAAFGHELHERNRRNDTPGWKYMAMLAAMAAGGYGLSELGLAGAAGEGAFGASGLAEGALASEMGFVPGAFELGASGYGGTAAAGLDAAAAGAGAMGGLPDAVWGVNSQGGNMFDWESFLSDPEGVDLSSFDPGVNPLDQFNFSDPSSGVGNTSSLLNPELASTFGGGTLFGAADAGSNTLTDLLAKLGINGQNIGSGALKSLLGGDGTGALGGALNSLLSTKGLTGAALLAGLFENPDRTSTVRRSYDSPASNKALAAADAYAAQGQGAVAPLSANELQAQALAASSPGRTDAFINRAAGLTDQAALGIPGVDLNTYMNPYIQSVLDPILKRGQIEKAQTVNKIGANAGMHNAFGGSRANLLMNQASESADRNLNEAEAGVRAGAFTSALNTAGTDLNRQLSAGSQFGALGNYLSAITGQDISRLSSTGETARGVEQAKLNVPLTQLAAYKAAQPAQNSFTQTTTGPDTSKWLQLAGALQTLNNMS